MEDDSALRCAQCARLLDPDCEECPECFTIDGSVALSPQGGVLSGIRLKLSVEEGDPPVPIRWLLFYIWVRIPYRALTAAVWAPFATGNDRFGLVFYAVFSMAVGLGLHRRANWAWALNWALLLFDTIAPLVLLPHIPSTFIAATVFAALWFVPNAIYFERRKYLFRGGEQAQTSEFRA